MGLATTMDGFGRAGWIALTILGFWVFWPLGLALLAFLVWSGRMWGCKFAGAGRWHHATGERSSCGWQGRLPGTPSSGNQAFDEYRAETLRRLEQEQKEFIEYLERLRRAKDKAEFDQFMAERRRRSEASDQPDAV